MHCPVRFPLKLNFCFIDQIVNGTIDLDPDYQRGTFKHYAKVHKVLKLPRRRVDREQASMSHAILPSLTSDKYQLAVSADRNH